MNQLNERVLAIIEQALAGQRTTRVDALTLLREVGVNSLEMGLLCAAADRLTRQRFGGIGEVFSQNAACSVSS